MRIKHIILPVVIVLFLVLGVVGLFSERQVTLQLEGQSVVITTSALRVKGALTSAGISLQEGDVVDPGRNALIHNGDVIQLQRALLVEIRIGDQTHHITTTRRTPGEWLSEAGVSLSPNDQVFINGQATAPGKMMVYLPSYSLAVRKAVTITLHSGTSQWQIESAASTMGEALWDAGFILSETDQLTPPPETPLNGPITAHLTPGKLVTVQADGAEYQVHTSAQTVGSALAQIGLSLQGLDYSVPAEDQALPENGLIKLVRVSEQVVIDQTTIPYDYDLQPDPELEIDQLRVIQAGQVGLKASRVRVRSEDGQETSRIIEDQWVAQEPVTRIQGYGTKIVIRTVDTPNGPVEYWRAVQMYATSYSPCRSAGEPGKCYPVTSSGLPVVRGVVAVILDWYLQMRGQGVYIPGYGRATIEDVGGGIPGRYWIDLGFTDDEYESWHQYVTVYFTTPVPPADQIVYILISN